MVARTHDLAAITALGLAVFAADPVPNITVATALAAILANQLGGIAPDIDQPTAPLWRNLPIGGIIGRFIHKMLGGHRFITHSLLGMFLLGMGVQLTLTVLQPIMPRVDIDYVWWAFMLGMFSHLVMDTLTKEGVPWLLPLPIKFGIPPIRRLRITTSSLAETGIVFPALLLFDIWFCASHYQQLVDIVRRHLV